MVISDKIKSKYITLLELVENEAKNSSTIWEYFDYLNDHKEKFISSSNVYCIDDLKEFLRGANRYSDEFVFLENNYNLIRKTTNELYEILNNTNP